MQMQSKSNLNKTKIKQTVKYLSIESPSPIAKNGSNYFSTQYAQSYRIDQDNIDKITAIRIHEQEVMDLYVKTKNCLMSFLQNELNDPCPKPCGVCANCDPDNIITVDLERELVNEAIKYLKRSYQVIKPRKQWPQKGIFKHYKFDSFIIPKELQPQEGRALCMWKDPGWGQLVYEGKYVTNRFSDELVKACAEMIRDIKPETCPKWVTCIPSSAHPELIRIFQKDLHKN